MMSATMRISWAKPSREELLRRLATNIATHDADAYAQASARGCVGNASAIPNDDTGIAQATPGDELKWLHEQVKFARTASQINQLIGQILGASIPDTEKDALHRLAHSKRSPIRAAELGQTALGRAASKSRFAARRHPKSPNREASRNRRRQLGGSSALPRQLRHDYTEGQRAVWCVVGAEIELRGFCDWPNDKIAAIAGCSLSTVHKALTAGKINRLVEVTARPRRGQKSDTNIIRIISPEWKAWLQMRPQRRVEAIGCFLQTDATIFHPTKREDKKKWCGNERRDVPSSLRPAGPPRKEGAMDQLPRVVT